MQPKVRPGILERAREKLSGRPGSIAVWDDWLAGRGDLRQLLTANLKDAAAVRAEIRAARNAGLDPDLRRRSCTARLGWPPTTPCWPSTKPARPAATNA